MFIINKLILRQFSQIYGSPSLKRGTTFGIFYKSAMIQYFKNSVIMDRKRRIDSHIYICEFQMYRFTYAISIESKWLVQISHFNHSLTDVNWFWTICFVFNFSSAVIGCFRKSQQLSCLFQWKIQLFC